MVATPRQPHPKAAPPVTRHHLFIANALGAHTAILDGEIVALAPGGVPRFEQLQQRIALNGDAEIRRKMKQVPVHGRIVPIPDQVRTATGEVRKVEVSDGTWDYIYEPDARELLDGMMRRYMEAIVLQMVNENMASEQSARMVAMKAASDNAGKIITELQLIYNKTRQAGITKELSEIVGGAAAV